MLKKRQAKLLVAAKEHVSEEILAHIYGVYEGTYMGKKMKNDGILLITERRVVVFGKDIFGGFELESIPKNMITNVNQRKDLMGGTVTISTASGDIQMKMVLDGISEFVSRLY